jgi:hypothetical protein
MHQVPVIDYGRHGKGMLLATGAGLMMATMDAIPELRYAIDLSGGKWPRGIERCVDWLIECDHVGFLVVHAWYSVSDPQPMRALLAEFAGRVDIVVRSNVDLGVPSVPSFNLLSVAASGLATRCRVHHCGHCGDFWYGNKRCCSSCGKNTQTTSERPEG